MAQARKSSMKSPSTRTRVISGGSHRVRTNYDRDRGDSIIDRLRRPSEPDSEEVQAKNQRRKSQKMDGRTG